MNPRNVLSDEADFDFDGKGIVGNIKCGDEMAFYIKVDSKKQTITDCRWKTYGCASAIASTSALSEMVKNMTLDDAFKITPKDVAKKLGELPDHKIHCSVLGDKALREAINDYYQKQGMTDKIVKEDINIICKCMNVTDHDIEDAVLEGAREFVDVQGLTKCSTGCGSCKEEITDLIAKYVATHFNK